MVVEENVLFAHFLTVRFSDAAAQKYTFSPAELSSEREEKEVLADSKQPTAPPSTKSHVSYCTARVAEERKWRSKVHQARRDDRFSSRFLSLLLTAAIVPTHPIPLLLCSPLPLSLSLSLSLSLRPGLMYSKMGLCQLYIICYNF